MLAAQIIVKVVAPSSGTNTVTLVIAVLGLVAALGSLLWQWFSYRLAGPRLKVALRRGYMGPGNLVSGRADFDASAQMALQGLTEQLIGVEVQNVGRLPISIDGAQAKFESGMLFGETLTINPVVGMRLEPHSSESWWVRWDALVAVATASAAANPKWNHPQKIRMVVSPAAGKKKETKEHVLIRPGKV